VTPTSVTSISTKWLTQLTSNTAKGSGKEAFPFWLSLGQATSLVSRSALSEGKNGLGSGRGQDLSRFAKFADALRQLGLPLNSLRLP
jgi:hypothetical protein